MCKGICPRYKAKKPVGVGRYASGQKRCKLCEIYVWWNGIMCPCCNSRLRTKPRSLIYKEKYKFAKERGEVVEFGIPMKQTL